GRLAMAELHAEISGADGPDREADDAGRIEDLLRSLAGTVRNFRLYAGNGPMVERFIEALREKLGALWQDFDRVQLAIAERTMTWEDRHVYPVGDASGELAFLFYKDGIRSITL